jgi:hypothetical protein
MVAIFSLCTSRAVRCLTVSSSVRFCASSARCSARARTQEVPDPQQDLELLERLRQEVLCARRQGLALRLQRRVGREDEHGQEHVRGDLVAELAEHRETVEMRHHEVEQDEVGAELPEQVEGSAGVGGRGQALVAGILKQALHEEHVGRLVVDDQDPRVVERWRHAAGLTRRILMPSRYERWLATFARPTAARGLLGPLSRIHSPEKP